MRHVITVLLVCVFGSGVIHAEVLTIPVVGQGWQIKFEGPVLEMESQEMKADGLTYQGNAGRFNVSAWVKAGAGSVGDNKACRDHFWQQANQSPTVQKESVKQWSTATCECVEYVTADEGGVKGVLRANIDCYFEMLGKWVDVHASVISATEDDTLMLKALGESLMYCTFAESKGGSQEFVMGDLGLLRFDVPAAWRVGNRCVTRGIGSGEQHTLSFFSATDPGKTWKITFFNSAVSYKTQKDILQTAQTAPRSAAAAYAATAGGSEGGAGEFHEIKMKHGVGCHVEYTEVFSADKPAEGEADKPAEGEADKGDAAKGEVVKVVSSAFVAPVPHVLGMSMIFAGDAKDADFLAAIQALGTLEWVAAKAE